MIAKLFLRSLLRSIMSGKTWGSTRTMFFMAGAAGIAENQFFDAFWMCASVRHR